MQTVSARKGCDDSVPSVRTEADEGRADGDRPDSKESARPAHLHEPLAHRPFLLLQPHRAQLAQRVGRIVEHSEDVRAVDDSRREHHRLGVTGLSRFSAMSRKPAVRSSRASSRTSWSRIGMPARRTRSSVHLVASSASSDLVAMKFPRMRAG
jgi:hypothetical protein